MDFLFNLIPGGGLTVIIGAAVAGALALWRAIATIKKAGRNERIAEEAVQRARNLDDVKRAQDAARGVRPDDGGVLDDPHNRDNRR